jgi:hypothetical protein
MNKKVKVTVPIHHPKEPAAAVVPCETTKNGMLEFLSNNIDWYNYAIEQGWIVELE